MPKTKVQNIVFTIIMAVIMVYGMIIYNVALNTGGVSNQTFLVSLHELPIMATGVLCGGKIGWQTGFYVHAPLYQPIAVRPPSG